jgi:hypothetical protein
MNMKRIFSILLALLAAVLFPVLIWVGLFIAIRPRLVRVTKKVGGIALALLAGVSVPVLIWVGLFVALKERAQEWQLGRTPPRTITEILHAAGITLQHADFPEGIVAKTRFVPKSIPEIHGMFSRAGL